MVAAQALDRQVPGQPDVTAVATSFWMILALVIVLPVVLTTRGVVIDHHRQASRQASRVSGPVVSAEGS